MNKKWTETDTAIVLLLLYLNPPKRQS